MQTSASLYGIRNASQENTLNTVDVLKVTSAAQSGSSSHFFPACTDRCLPGRNSPLASYHANYTISYNKNSKYEVDHPS